MSLFSKNHKLVNKSQEYYWLGLTDEEFNEVLMSNFNPMDQVFDFELKHPGLREIYLMNRPEYFYLLCKLLLNIELYPLQCVVLEELWNHYFSILLASRGFSKTFSLAVYCFIKMILRPGIQIVGVGAAFRQSKLILNYMTQIWKRADVLHSIFKGGANGPKIHTDAATFSLGPSKAIFLPLGDGSKIRGLRASCLLVDEVNELNMEVYQTVVEQFAAVSMDPINNMKKASFRKYLEETGAWDDSMEEDFKIERNQSIMSGTIGSTHENMNVYLDKYSNIIKSKGSEQVFKELFDEVPEDVDYKDFCVIRIPYDLVPDGFMDKQVVAKAKATMDPSIFLAEYGTCPISDTHGFYKKSLIDGCTASYKNTQQEWWPKDIDEFYGVIRGNPKKTYVYGIDPAHSSDNFAIVILEVNENHSRIVYCWTTSKKAFSKQKTLTDETNYFAYCAKKIRSLMTKFPTDNIVMDTQGGGRAIEEALHDMEKLKDGELPLWPVIDPDKEQDTDMKQGRHILHMTDMVQTWQAQANHALRKDLEDKILFFPAFDSVIAGTNSEAMPSSVDYDRQDECMLELESLKREIISIVKQQTPTGKERWDTPDNFSSMKLKTTEKLRKDRFSALLLANSVARGVKIRTLNVHNIDTANYAVGRVGDIVKTSNEYYIGNRPDHLDPPAHLFRGINR